MRPFGNPPFSMAIPACSRLQLLPATASYCQLLIDQQDWLGANGDRGTGEHVSVAR
jgi:hypothetical protein